MRRPMDSKQRERQCAGRGPGRDARHVRQHPPAHRLAPDTEGGFTSKDGEVTTIYEAATEYSEARTPLCVLAGKEYGSGSLRDWAAAARACSASASCWRSRTSGSTAPTWSGWGSCPCSSRTASRLESLGLAGEESFDLAPLEESARTLEVTARPGDGADPVKLEASVRIDTPTSGSTTATAGSSPSCCGSCERHRDGETQTDAGTTDVAPAQDEAAGSRRPLQLTHEAAQHILGAELAEVLEHDQAPRSRVRRRLLDKGCNHCALIEVGERTLVSRDLA